MSGFASAREPDPLPTHQQVWEQINSIPFIKTKDEVMTGLVDGCDTVHEIRLAWHIYKNTVGARSRIKPRYLPMTEADVMRVTHLRSRSQAAETVDSLREKNFIQSRIVEPSRTWEHTPLIENWAGAPRAKQRRLAKHEANADATGNLAYEDAKVEEPKDLAELHIVPAPAVMNPAPAVMPSHEPFIVFPSGKVMPLSTACQNDACGINEEANKKRTQCPVDRSLFPANPLETLGSHNNDNLDLWQIVNARLRKRLTDESYQNWIEDTKRGGVLTVHLIPGAVGVPSQPAPKPPGRSYPKAEEKRVTEVVTEEPFSAEWNQLVPDMWSGPKDTAVARPVFNEIAKDPKRLKALLENTPGHDASKPYADRWTKLSQYLRSGVWEFPAAKIESDSDWITEGL
jgi:hypothetical protein